MGRNEGRKLAGTHMPLTDVAIRKLRPREKMYRVSDGAGLALQVEAAGGKNWRFRYRYAGKEKMISLGAYPEISLSAARNERQRCRELVRTGIDPSQQKQKERVALAVNSKNTFGAIAEEFIRKRKDDGLAARTIKKKRTLLTLLLPDLQNQPIKDIDPPKLLAVLRKAENRGIRVAAIEARGLAGEVFRYAIATGRATHDISNDLRGALKTPFRKGRAGITDPKMLGTLLLDIEGYNGDPITKGCLELLIRLFVRPGEIREACWDEIKWQIAEWRIPEARMKMRREHIVPLPPQAVSILQTMWGVRADNKLVAGSRAKKGRPLSDMAFNKAFRSMGYDNQTHVAHGCRVTASTLLNEQGYNPDWIERQLAHVHRDPVRRAYNAAKYLDGRTKMMVEWNDYLDRLREEARTKSAPLR